MKTVTSTVSQSVELACKNEGRWWYWSMVAGGALFSSLTVISWGETILSSFAKAIGLAVLVEGVMLASRTEWLSISALALLIIIYAISCAVAFGRVESH